MKRPKIILKPVFNAEINLRCSCGQLMETKVLAQFQGNKNLYELDLVDNIPKLSLLDAMYNMGNMSAICNNPKCVCYKKEYQAGIRLIIKDKEMLHTGDVVN